VSYLWTLTLSLGKYTVLISCLRWELNPGYDDIQEIDCLRNFTSAT